jgi:uncharacterized DUF497 family protein
MRKITLSWGDKKAAENLRKHGVSFEEAASVFSDENARLIHDPDHSSEEERYILLGFSSKLRLLIVHHTYRRGEQEIRIISARKATRREGRQYGGFL